MEGSFAEWIYDSLNGDLIEEYRCKGVENLFAEGSECLELYGQIYEASLRICERLEPGKDKEEDEDTEIMINSMLKMMEIVALKMYEYGAKFGMRT